MNALDERISPQFERQWKRVLNVGGPQYITDARGPRIDLILAGGHVIYQTQFPSICRGEIVFQQLIGNDMALGHRNRRSDVRVFTRTVKPLNMFVHSKRSATERPQKICNRSAQHNAKVVNRQLAL